MRERNYQAITPEQMSLLEARVDAVAETIDSEMETQRTFPSISSRISKHSNIRWFFAGAVLLTLGMIAISENMFDEEESQLGKIWALGFSGIRAQRLADASMVKSTDLWDLAGEVSKTKDSKEKKHKHDEEVPTPGSNIPEGCESTVMLIRHCEKGHLRSHCNYVGFERAAYLATLFGDAAYHRWPVPSQLYALNGQRKHGKFNYREIETVDFIAEQHNQTINDEFKTSQTKTLADNILKSIVQGNGEMCGKLTLVSWKHSDIPHLAQRLGCGPLQGCPMDYKGKQFDQVWQIKYVYRGFMHNGRNGKKHLTKKHWDIFGSVQYEYFDPLAYSKGVGDYPTGGTSEGARWKDPRVPLYD